MSKSLSAQLKLTLLDAVTAPARTIQRNLQGLKASVKTNAAEIGAMQGQLLGAVGAAYGLARGLAAPVNIAREFETTMLDIAQKAELSDAAMGGLARRIRDIAPAMNQTSQEVAKGMDVLLGMGMDAKAAEGVIPVLGKVATAYMANIDDLAKTAMASIDNLKLSVDEMPRAMDMLAAAGKAGAFELKDMAQHMPALAAMAQSRGMTGLKAMQDLAAALQIVRKGTGDSASAATNLQNVLQKLTSEETVKRFKKIAKIDLKKELEKTAKLGMSPIEGIATIVDQIVKRSKGKISIADLFTDMQVQLGMASLVQNLEEFKKIQAEVGKANGVWMEDFQRRMKTNDARTKEFRVRLNELGLSIGNIILPAMNSLMRTVAPVIRGFEQFAEKHPQIVGGVLKIASALIALRIAAIGASFGLKLLKGGAGIALAAAMIPASAAATGIATAVGGIGAAALLAQKRLRAMRAGIIALNAVGGGSAVLGALGGSLLAFGKNVAAFPLVALRSLGRAMRGMLVASPVGLAITAIVTALAALGTWVYNNWDGIKTFFSSFASSFREGLSPELRATVDGLASGLGSIFGWVGKLLGPLDETGKKWQEWGSTIGGVVANGVNTVANAIAKVIGLLRDGVNAAISFGRAVGNALSSKGAPVPGSTMDGMMPPGGVDGARAKGGPVSKGKTYLVGEKGPETFTAGASGFVTPNDVYRRGVKAANASQGHRINVGGISVQVHMAHNDNPQNVGDVIGQRIRNALEGAYADGVV